MKVDKVRLYPDRDDVTLTIYILDDSPELLNGQKRPAILICPGGAYLTCSDREAEPIALQFNAQGYHAFVLRYSVFNMPFEQLMNPKAELEKNENSLYPAQIRDLGAAMLYIREYAKEWFVDVDRIALCGFSAGGNNVLTYAVHYDKSVLTDYLGATPEQLRPAAVIAGYPITDYLYMKDTTYSPMEKKLFDVSNLALFGTQNPTDNQRLQLSPARLVTDQVPPVFIWATAADKLVPVGHTTRMTTALADAGVPFESHIFEEGQHGLSTAKQVSSGNQTEIRPDVAEWLGLAETWLEKRFRLTLPEKGLW
ncbi:alpha/beta hydrolase [Streptococcus merionis]|uniref:Esterase n=1 Tax=Streptococcus merionis TaxID=400065 RepID=A0A239T0G2_9STRE|nr:alpha/beta hydrolase [Streptococcus merionis]SNU91076.1 esterase [Streptococcus merionis]